MSSIDGISANLLSSMLTQGTRSKQDPAEKFKTLDADSNGVLDTTELSAMAKELASMTGKTLDVDNSITTYDANNDGLLNQDETNAMIRQVLGPPPDMSSGVSMQQATEAYLANAGNDQLSAFLKMLDQTTSSPSTSSSENDLLSTLLKMLRSTDSSSEISSRPNPEEKFKELDSDSSGGLNQTELDAMAEDFSKMTGQTIDTTETISTYDADKNGELSKNEMDIMMAALRGKTGSLPSPPSSGATANASDTTQTLSEQDKVSLLRQLLEQYANNLSAGTSTNITSYI